jgi:pimeloyl-ACP methyl ester carboxylesterase
MKTTWLLIWQCALMELNGIAQPTNDSWVDKSPHKEAFARVNGISLDYLDWGGRGEPLLFLAGLGNTAHIFDDIAPGFTNHFRVLALTRRGYGRSDKPQNGYELNTLVEDLRQFLDLLKLKSVVFAGHSFAGAELNQFAGAYPGRVDKLVYFDCAYSFDQPGTMEVFSRMDSLTPSASSQVRANFSTLRDWFRNNRPGWNDACESDLRNTRVMTPQGYSGHSSTPDSVEETLEKETLTAHCDYTKLTMPVLAFFADHQLDKLVDQAPAANRQQAEETRSLVKAWQRGQIDRFKTQVKNSQVVELRDTDHFCFIQRPDEIARSMKAFLEP